MENFINTLKAYKKSITALVGAGMSWAYLIVGSAETQITATEWVVGAGLLATAAGVYKFTNEPKY